MVNVGKDQRQFLVQLTVQSRVSFETKLLCNLSSQFLKTSKNGYCTASLGLLSDCPHAEKTFPYIQSEHRFFSTYVH